MRVGACVCVCACLCVWEKDRIQTEWEAVSISDQVCDFFVSTGFWHERWNFVKKNKKGVKTKIGEKNKKVFENAEHKMRQRHEHRKSDVTRNIERNSYN